MHVFIIGARGQQQLCKLTFRITQHDLKSLNVLKLLVFNIFTLLAVKSLLTQINVSIGTKSFTVLIQFLAWFSQKFTSRQQCVFFSFYVYVHTRMFLWEPLQMLWSHTVQGLQGPDCYNLT